MSRPPPGLPILLQWQRAIRDDPALPPTTRLVALTASTWADVDGRNVYPGAATLAAGCGLASERGVRTHLEVLVAAGWLDRVERGGRAGTVARAAGYRLTFPTGIPVPDEIRPTGSPVPDGDGPNRHRGAAQPAPPCLPTGTGVPTTDPMTDPRDRHRVREARRDRMARQTQDLKALYRDSVSTHN